MTRKYGALALVPLIVGTGLVLGSAGTSAAAASPVLSYVPHWQPFQDYPPRPVDRERPTRPVLSLTQFDDDTIRLDWTAATDNVGVVAYDIFAATSPFRFLATVGPHTLRYFDDRPEDVTVSYYVVARDAAGNTARSNIVTRVGERPRHDVDDTFDDSDVANTLSDAVMKTDSDDWQRNSNFAAQTTGLNFDRDSREQFGIVIPPNDSDGGPAAQGVPQETDGPGGTSQGHEVPAEAEDSDDEGPWADGPEGDEDEGGAREMNGAGGGPGGPAQGGQQGGQQAGGSLPYTGAPLGPLAGAAGALLILGLAATRFARRRSRGER